MDRSRRQAREDRRRAEQRRSQMRWLVFVVIAAVAVTAILILSNQVRQPEERTYTQKNGIQLGDPNAPVTLVEYADFQCIHCYNFYNETEELVIQNHVETGEVLYELRMIGILGPDSLAAAEAAYCAADQDLYWEYHDVVFANYNTGYDESRLIGFAETVGADIDQFTSCLDSDEKLETVELYHDEAGANGITGTPGFVLNGQLLASGNLPYIQIQEAIQAALGE